MHSNDFTSSVIAKCLLIQKLSLVSYTSYDHTGISQGYLVEGGGGGRGVQGGAFPPNFPASSLYVQYTLG